MRKRKTQKYNHELTEFRQFRLDVYQTFCNQLFQDDDEYRWYGSKIYRKPPMSLPFYNDDREEFCDWLDNLKDEYHDLYEPKGERIQIYQNKYKKILITFHKICQDYQYKGGLYYSDEERIVMCFVNELFFYTFDKGRINTQGLQNYIGKHWNMEGFSIEDISRDGKRKSRPKKI